MILDPNLLVSVSFTPKRLKVLKTALFIHSNLL